MVSLAAYGGSGKGLLKAAEHNPMKALDVNVIGTHNLLQCAIMNNIEKFIHTSTSEVYGTAQYVPIDEKHPMQPQSPYSASKIAADSMAMSFFNAFFGFAYVGIMAGFAQDIKRTVALYPTNDAKILTIFTPCLQPSHFGNPTT